jgi:hypothetical protein
VVVNGEGVSESMLGVVATGVIEGKNSPEWWAKMGGFGWAYARQGALWVPKEKPTGGPGGG